MPAKSRAQQRFMGMLYQCKATGKCASEDIRKKAEKISLKDAKKYAETKHKGLPERKKKMEKFELPSFVDYLGEMDTEIEGASDDAMAMYQELDPKRQAIVRHMMNQMLSAEDGNIDDVISAQFDDQESEMGGSDYGYYDDGDDYDDSDYEDNDDDFIDNEASEHDF